MEEYSSLMNSSAKPEWIPPAANHPGKKIKGGGVGFVTSRDTTY